VCRSVFPSSCVLPTTYPHPVPTPPIDQIIQPEAAVLLAPHEVEIVVTVAALRVSNADDGGIAVVRCRLLHLHTVKPLDADAIIDAAPSLIVPHPRFRERRFVLDPLAEIAGEWIDPVTGKTVAGLRRELLSRDAL